MEGKLKERLSRVVLAGIFCTGLLLVAAGPAAASNDQVRLKIAMQHVASGSVLTSADVAVIRSHPDVARIVPDPNGFTFDPGTIKTTMIGPLDGHSTYEPTWTQRSFFGNTLYTRHYHIEWTWLGPSEVTSWVTRYDFITDVDPVIYFRELVADQADAAGGITARTFRERHIEYCAAKVACYANT